MKFASKILLSLQARAFALLTIGIISIVVITMDVGELFEERRLLGAERAHRAIASRLYVRPARRTMHDLEWYREPSMYCTVPDVYVDEAGHTWAQVIVQQTQLHSGATPRGPASDERNVRVALSFVHNGTAQSIERFPCNSTNSKLPCLVYKSVGFANVQGISDTEADKHMATRHIVVNFGALPSQLENVTIDVRAWRDKELSCVVHLHNAGSRLAERRRVNKESLKRKDLLLCVRILATDHLLNEAFVLEWLMHHLALGADEIHVYLHDLPQPLVRMLYELAESQQLGRRVRLIDFSAGTSFEWSYRTFDFGQVIAIRDCHMSNAARFRYWAQLDVDEFVTLSPPYALLSDALDEYFAAAPMHHSVTLTSYAVRPTPVAVLRGDRAICERLVANTSTQSAASHALYLDGLSVGGVHPECKLAPNTRLSCDGTCRIKYVARMDAPSSMCINASSRAFPCDDKSRALRFADGVHGPGVTAADGMCHVCAHLANDTHEDAHLPTVRLNHVRAHLAGYIAKQCIKMDRHPTKSRSEQAYDTAGHERHLHHFPALKAQGLCNYSDNGFLALTVFNRKPLDSTAWRLLEAAIENVLTPKQATVEWPTIEKS